MGLKIFKESSQLYLIFLLFLIQFQLFSQVRTIENNTYILSDSTRGKANYQYTLSRKDTLKNGRFEFFYSQFDTTSEAIFSKKFTGYFKENKKDKAWTYSQKELIQSPEKQIKDYEIVRTASGTEFMVNAFFNGGKATGQWNVSHHTIVNSKPQDTLLHIQLSFLEGRPTGALTALNKSALLKGSFEGKGRPHGSWVMQHKGLGMPVLEFRTYDEGVLKEHFFMVEQERVEVVHLGLDMTPDGENESWETFTVGQDYFKIISFAKAGFEKKKNINLSDATLELLLSNSDMLFQQALTRFGKNQDLNYWQLVEGSQPIVYPIFKVRKFPFKPEEKKQIETVISKIKKIDALLERFFEQPELEINKYGFKDLSQFFAKLVLHKNELENWLLLSNKIENPSFEYVDRSEVFKSILPEINYPEKVIYLFKDQEIEEPFSFSSQNSITFTSWQDVLSFLQNKEKKIQELITGSNKILDQVKRQTELSVLEKDLVKARDTVLVLYNNNSEREDYNDFHKRLAPKVRDFVNEKFKEYASLSLEEKNSSIYFYIECFEDLQLVYEKSSDFPRKINRLDELYTRTTFNPYLMSNMDERVKSRVYEAYEKYLLPYLLEKLETNLDCKENLNRTRTIEMLYSRMLELREQDTKQMERDLRRVKDPEEIIKIFNISIE